jgi:Na+/melibiose symporter-like transporter
MSVIPGVFGFVAAATVLLYDLDEGKVAHIGGELARRRASEGSAKP